MFTRSSLIVTVVVLFCLVIVWIGVSIFPTNKSKQRFLILSQETKEQKDLVSTHKQLRERVRKDLYVTRINHRLQAVLTCPLSELTLTHVKGEAEVVENLKKFQCLMQEEIYSLLPDGTKILFGEEGKPMQIVRDFNAVSGKFYYQRHLLTANRVFVSRFLLPGWELPDVIKDYEPTMKGVARSAELTFGNGFKFKAQNLKATFFVPGLVK
ncbi:MAG: hypothetical protein K940chlam3_00684 [Chlamydiae bacterium]|nr:hypothetical protein [Chlamydiota bacterium]